MRFTPTKKISELEALTSATLDTTFVVGISGSTTYKISINQLTSSLDGAFATDLVTNALSNSLDTKLATTIFNTNSASFHSRINAVSSSVSTGTSGTSGTSGPQGNQGPIGPQGINGTAGSSGVQGPQGNQGVDGSNGTSGTNGSQGTQGPQGEVGPQGISGTAGSSGVQGAQGNQGANGSNGPQGNQGSNGTNGSQGTQGPTGPQGTQGTDGTTFNISQYSGSVGITGSLTVSSIGISDSAFLTNTSSLTLTSGSNLYVQNNGIVEITGSLILSGSTNFTELTGSLASFSSSINSRIVSGSVQPLPSNLVSSSAQITAFGFVSSSTSINTGSLDLIGFNTSAGVSVGVGQLAWNNTDGTLDLGMKGGNVVQQIGQEIFYEVRNETGIQIPNGTAVYASGVTAGSGRITAAPYVADGSIREVRFLGIATENITSGVNGFVTHFGYVRDLDTRGTTASSIAVGDETWAVGDILYVHPTVSGKLTKVKPQHEVTAAIIITRHQSSGVIFVRPSSAGHLEDIHDILINTGSLSNGQVLSYNSTSGVWENTNTISGSSQLTSSFDSRYVQTGSFNTLSSSVDNRLDTLEATIISGSPNYTQVLGDKRTGITLVGTSIISGSITTTGNPVQIMVTGDANPVNVSSWTRLQIYRDENAIGAVVQVENSSNLNVPYCLNVIDTPPAGTYSYSMRTVSGISGNFDFGEHTGPLLTAVELNSKTSFPSGTISGSSQLTSSFDTRYTLSGSVQPLPSNLISGSSQLTSSFDARYALSGSSGAQGAQGPTGGTGPQGNQGNQGPQGNQGVQGTTFNINQYSGSVFVTGSLTVSSAIIVSSSMVANTSSLYLTSGSNLYVQNNGIVEITGSMIISGPTTLSGSVTIGPGGGSEGGEIVLAYAPSGNTLTGSAVSVDVYQNRLRIFEGGGNSRGVYIDLSKAPNGVAGELLYKASGFVNAGVDVTLGNLKARIPTSGYRSLQVSTVSGTYSVYGSSVYSYNGIGGITVPSGTPVSVTTTPTYLSAGYNFIVAGSTDTWNIMDTSAGIAWRITMIIGADFNNNMISIERLV
jgi:hypothetical protein